MPGLNLVQLIGYLGRDPEGRFTPSGTRVCNFSLAVTRRWTELAFTSWYETVPSATAPPGPPMTAATRMSADVTEADANS